MKPRNFFLVSLILIILSGCAAPTTTESHTPVAPTANTGSLVGSVPSAVTFWPGETLYIYAATFNGNDQNEGFYMLDTARAPSATLDSDGWFQLLDITPGRYVLVVGPTAEQGRLIMDANNKARIFTVVAGELEDLGILETGN